MSQGNWQQRGGAALWVRSGSLSPHHGRSSGPCGHSCGPAPPGGGSPGRSTRPAGWAATRISKAGKPAGQLGRSPERGWSWRRLPCPLLAAHGPQAALLRVPGPKTKSLPAEKQQRAICLWASWMCNSDHTPLRRISVRRSGISDFPRRSPAPMALWKITGINIFRVSSSRSRGSKKLQDHDHLHPHSATVPTASWVHFRGCF